MYSRNWKRNCNKIATEGSIAVRNWPSAEELELDWELQNCCNTIAIQFLSHLLTAQKSIVDKTLSHGWLSAVRIRSVALQMHFGAGNVKSAYEAPTWTPPSKLWHNMSPAETECTKTTSVRAAVADLFSLTSVPFRKLPPIWSGLLFRGHRSVAYPSLVAENRPSC